MTDCTTGARLCKPRRVPTPSGRFRYFHQDDCPARPGQEIRYATENALGRTWTHGFKGRRR